MKNKWIHVVIVLVILSAAAVLVVPKWTWKPEGKQVAPETVLSTGQMKADIDELKNLIQTVHPAAAGGLPEALEESIKSAYRAADNPMTVSEFYFVLSPIVTALSDAHTNISLSGQQKEIELPVRWINEKLVCRKDTVVLKRGDVVLSLGDKDIDACMDEVRATVPAENEYWRNSMAPHLMRFQYMLEHLGVVSDGTVDVEIERNGVRQQVALPIKESKPMNGDTQNISYQVIDGVGLLTIDRCVYDETYRQMMAQAFTDFKDAGVDRLIVDVRSNTGGNSQCLDELMTYIDVDTYEVYSGDVRGSWQAWVQRGSLFSTNAKPTVVSNKKKPNAFGGEIIVLTSSYTFSSGNWFAVVLKDNGLATVVGEPTGNMPTSYGDTLRFKLNNSGIHANIAFKKWHRPNEQADDEDSLYPDVLIPAQLDGDAALEFCVKNLNR